MTAYDDAVRAGIASIPEMEGEIDCPDCKGSGESDVSLSHRPGEEAVFPGCGRCEGEGRIDLTTHAIVARVLAASLPSLGGLLPRAPGDWKDALIAEQKLRRDAEDNINTLRSTRDLLTGQRDEWWAQAHGLRAAVARHHEDSDNEALYVAARKAWRWPSFGNEAFDADYPAPPPEDQPECERCEGTGDRYGRSDPPKTTCPDCGGSGHVPALRAEGPRDV